MAIVQLKHVCESCKWTDRNYYIMMRDISRYCRVVVDIEIRLDDNDAILLHLWVLRLQQGGAECVLKDKMDPPSEIWPVPRFLCSMYTN